MPSDKSADKFSRPVRASEGDHGHASARALEVWKGPSSVWNGKTFDAGQSSIVSIVNALGTRDKVTKPYEESGWVHACLKPFGQAVASVPGLVYDRNPDEHKDAQPLKATDGRFGAIVRLLTAAPNPVQTSSQFFEAGALHQKLDGEDFWFLLDRMGKPIAVTGAGMVDVPAMILSVRGAVVSHQLDAHGMPKLWRVSLAGGGLLEAGPDQVVHFRDYNPDDPTRGIGDVEALLADIDYEWQASRYNRALVKNSGDPGGFIVVEGAQLAPEESEAAENEANQKFDVSQAGRYRVLTGRGVKYEPNKIGPKDMDFAALMAWTRDKICAVTGIPPPIIGVLENATLANFVESVKMFWEGGNGVCSYLRSRQDVITHRFLRRLRVPGAENLYFRFDLRGVKALREDNSKQYEIAARLASLNIGLSIKEALELLQVEADVSGMPHADSHLVTAGLVPIEVALAQESIDGEDGEGDAAIDPALALKPDVAVQDTGLNGSQISALIEIVDAVSSGFLTPDGAVAMILIAFPTIDEAEAKRIVDGAIEKPPEPEPDPPEPGAPAGDGEKPPPADPPSANKALEPIGKEAEAAVDSVIEPTDPATERRSYWAAKVAPQLEAGERSLKRAYKGWRRKYERAQLARLRNAAAEAKHATPDHVDPAVKMIARAAADGPPLDGQPRFTEQDIADLLLDDREWIAKLRGAFQDPIARIFANAIEEIADELGGTPLSGSSPEVLARISSQLIKLAEGHTSTLAAQVREVLIEELSKASSTGSVSAALVEVLPEVEDGLRQSFTDRQTRANLIARTEVGAATNRARLMQMRESGFTHHEWVTSNDSIVRGAPGGPNEDAEFSHYALDGVVVPIGAQFAAGLEVPGDVNAPAGQRCNCRCGTRAVKNPEDGGVPAQE